MFTGSLNFKDILSIVELIVNSAPVFTQKALWFQKQFLLISSPSDPSHPETTHITPFFYGEMRSLPLHNFLKTQDDLY